MDVARLYLVFEYVPMDLKKFIDTRPKKHLDEVTTRSFTYQVIIQQYLGAFLKNSYLSKLKKKKSLHYTVN